MLEVDEGSNVITTLVWVRQVSQTGQTGQTGQTAARPLLHGQDKLTVWYGLRLIMLEVDEGSNVITTSVWVRQVSQTGRHDRQARQPPSRCSRSRIN